MYRDDNGNVILLLNRKRLHHTRDNHGGIGDINGDTVYILLLDRTRLHQVDGGYDGGGQLTSQ